MYSNRGGKEGAVSIEEEEKGKGGEGRQRPLLCSLAMRGKSDHVHKEKQGRKRLLLAFRFLGGKKKRSIIKIYISSIKCKVREGRLNVWRGEKRRGKGYPHFYPARGKRKKKKTSFLLHVEQKRKRGGGINPVAPCCFHQGKKEEKKKGGRGSSPICPSLCLVRAKGNGQLVTQTKGEGRAPWQGEKR